MKKAYVGQHVTRVDALAKVTGEAKYPADYYHPEMLHLKVLRAPHPHALIKHIDTSKATKLPGVVKVITAADIPEIRKFGLIIKDQEVLVRDKTRYMGDALAVVAAETEQLANQALKLIHVDYEELEVITNPLRAMESDAARIHQEGNVLCVHDLSKGDIEQGFAEADVIVTNQFSTSAIEHAALQPESGTAVYDAQTGEYTLWVATQWLHDTQIDMAQSLGVARDKVRIINPTIGGAFGKREDISVHLHLAIMARITNRPVKYCMSREESMIAQSKRHPIIFRLKTGVKSDGTLTAWQAEVIGDTGSYASSGPAVVHKAMYLSTGPYNIPHVEGKAYTVYTNNTYCGAMRGFGVTQAAFAYESQMDCIANKLGMDPIDFRLKNGFELGSTTANGQALTTSVGYKETVQRAVEKAGYSTFDKSTNNPRKKRGIGIATAMFGCGYGEGFPDHAVASVRVTNEGRIELKTAAADVGQGVLTVLTQIVADTLKVSMDLVDITPGDTHITKNSGSTSASRQTIFSGNAAYLASQGLLGKIYDQATKISNSGFPEIRLADGQVFFGAEQTQMTFGQLAKVAADNGEPLVAEGCFFPETIIDVKTGSGEVVYLAFTFNTQVATVEVDLDTGQVDVLRMVNVVDVGKAIYPQGVEGQTEGASVMGMGMALLEEQVYDQGRTLNPDFTSYLIPTALDIPEVETVIVESGDAIGPFGAKGVGEPCLIGAAPAIINAIYDATGVRIHDLPARPDKLLQLIRKKERS